MKIRFGTYATYWIKQSIKHATGFFSQDIRVPAYMAELLTHVAPSLAQLQEKPAAALPRKK